jgi:tungstate transport system ATP-binding protein
MNGAAPVIEVRGLCVRREGRVAADIPHLELQNGEVLAIMGPNGAGKSSVLLALALLISARWESYRFEGEPISRPDHDLRVRRRMAFVFQDPLLLDATVLQNVMLGAVMRGIPQAVANKRALAWLERLGVGHLASRRARLLSGGEAQRVNLARAFALEPVVLLLDEPFSSLDVLSRLTLMKEMKPLLAQTSTSAILVTHEFTEAALLADRLVVMDGGKQVQCGTPAQVFRYPATPVVATLVEFAATMAGLLQADGCDV